MNTTMKSLFIFCLLFIVSLSLKAQVGIGTTNPNASAQLDVSSTTKGFLPPRMTFAQRNAIASPVQGLIIYCTDCVANGQIQVYNGNSWVYFDGQPFSVRIGTQVWMTENLNVATYRDGTLIPQVTDPTAWAGLTTGAWCWYNNDPTNGAIYGKLYNWYAVADSIGLCPLGWHVPTDAEWTTLNNFLGGESIAGGKMKSTSSLWNTSYYSNMGATNESGFTGHPGGSRYNGGAFWDLGILGYWWSASQYDAMNAWYEKLIINNNSSFKNKWAKSIACSVRCIKD